MTKEQAQKEFVKLLEKKIKEEDQIIQDAKEKGIWKQGLDSNSDLFIKVNAEFKKKVELLKTMIDD